MSLTGHALPSAPLGNAPDRTEAGMASLQRPVEGDTIIIPMLQIPPRNIYSNSTASSNVRFISTFPQRGTELGLQVPLPFIRGSHTACLFQPCPWSLRSLNPHAHTVFRSVSSTVWCGRREQKMGEEAAGEPEPVQGRRGRLLGEGRAELDPQDEKR